MCSGIKRCHLEAFVTYEGSRQPSNFGNCIKILCNYVHAYVCELNTALYLRMCRNRRTLLGKWKPNGIFKVVVSAIVLSHKIMLSTVEYRER